MIAILGAGESGIGAALLAAKNGEEVWVSDAGTIQKKYRQILEENKLPFEEGQHTKEKFFDATVIIKSPGIPDKVPIIQELKAEGKKILSEIEYASLYCKAPIVAVTGSNGKTTTASLIHHLLLAGGMDSALGGNVGKSFAALMAGPPHDVYVLEISSFQLDDIHTFRPQVAVLTNITADHLDRYDYSMEKYAAAKFRIGMNQEAEDAFIYCTDDAVTMGEFWKNPVKATKIGFSKEQKPESLIWMEDNEIVAGYKFRVDYPSLQLKGPHNAYNVMAAMLAARRMGLSDEAIQENLVSFSPIEHRMEPVGVIDGVTYINDSKATNVDAVYFALKSMKKPTVWIAGGLDKGNEYAILDIKAVKALVILGPNKEKLLEFYTGKIDPILEAANMKEAVTLSKGLAQKGDTVLLSPACSSFDIFKNFEERGRQFKEEVKKLKH